MVTVMVIKINKKRPPMGMATVMESQKTSKKKLATDMVIKIKKKRLITVMGTAMEQKTTQSNVF